MKQLRVFSLFLMCAIHQGSARSGEPRRINLHDLIVNVRANEQLYENLDIRLTSNYQCHTVMARAAVERRGEEPKEGEFIFFDGQKVRLHSVRQNGLFRAEREGAASSQGRSYSLDRIRAFDGSITRLYEQGAIGNIIQGRSEDETLIRPHMFLLAFMQFFVPLSTYMSGHEAMQAHPGTNWEPGYTLEVTYQGEAEFRGLICHRVWITTSVPGFNPHDRWELWLAEDRNFIPVRNLGYTFRFSQTLPVGEGQVDEWREIEPGIWFPTKVQFTAYNQWKLKTDVQEKQWTRQYVIEDISLKPKYDLAYFADVPFPDGTRVYEVADNKITSSYVRGAPNAPGGPDRRRTRWWLLPVGFVVFALIAVAVILRRVRSAKT